MSNLGPQQQNVSYDGILQIPGGVTPQLQWVQDGNGNKTGLQLSSTSTAVGVDLSVINIGTNGSITNHVSPHVFYIDGYTSCGVVSGSLLLPDTDKNPTAVFQKYTQYDANSIPAQQVGGIFSEVYVKGTGTTGTQDIEGTWTGIVGNSYIAGQNLGTPTSPDYDAYGSTIGVAGFARSGGPPGNGQVVTGLWGYATGPTIDATTYSNLPSQNWSLIGAEVNIQINTPDVGEQQYLVGKGSSAGFLASNYRAPGTGVRDWTFGMILAGTPSDGDYSNPDVNAWNGFYTGIMLDKIKAKGIRFGQFFKNNSYGIYFPDSYLGGNEPAAAIYLGNNKINLGQYVGSIFNNNDFWHNGGNLYFKYSGTTNRLIQQRGSAVSFSGDVDLYSGASDVLGIQASITGISVNKLNVISGTTGQAPAIAASGTDTNIDIELRTKGNGAVLLGQTAGTATNPSAFSATRYLKIKDETGNIFYIPCTTAPW